MNKINLKANRLVIVFGIIILFTVFTRLYDLHDKPLHHDESIHADFALKVYKGKLYSYDPTYHGPFLYYANALIYYMFGVTDSTSRMIPAIFGIMLIILIYGLREEIGIKGVLAASSIVALSPTFTYFSRFLRNDIYVATFMLAGVILFLRYRKTAKPWYLYLFSISIALSFCSKENSFIYALTFLSFIFLYSIYQAIFLRIEDRSFIQEYRIRFQSFTDYLMVKRLEIIQSLTIFVFIYILLYSSFFTNLGGVWDSIFRSFSYWYGQHRIARIPGPFTYYIPKLLLYEIPTIIFSIWATTHFIINRKRENLFYYFLIYWAFSNFVIYSYLQEKVPWLMVHIMLPMVILAGGFLGKLIDEMDKRKFGKISLITFMSLLGVYSLSTNIRLNFHNASNPSEPMIFVQTTRDIKSIAKEIEELSFKFGKDRKFNIIIEDEAAWPLSWYLRGYPVSYPAEIDMVDAPVVITPSENYDRFYPFLNRDYIARKYSLRAWWLVELKEFTWKKFWKFLIYREAFSPIGSTDIIMFVKRDIFSAVKKIEIPKKRKELVLPPHIRPILVKNILSWGSRGRENGEFDEPRAIAVDKEGNIYVVDTQNHRVQSFSSKGRFVRAWGQKGSGEGEFSGLCGIEVDEEGYVYVADTWNHRIQKFTSSGDFVSQFDGGSSGFWGPRDLIIDSKGDIYVVDTGHCMVKKFNKRGKLISQWGKKGDADGEFREPIGIAIDSEGLIYIADTLNQRIQVFDSKGAFKRKWKVYAWYGDKIKEPYIDIRDNSLYLTDSSQSRILKYSIRGEFIKVWGIPGQESGKFNCPIGIAIDRKNYVYIADTFNHRIQKFLIE